MLHLLCLLCSPLEPRHGCCGQGYYGARLRSASRLAPTKDVAHGGYVVPRAGGNLPDGLLMKAMAIVGSGGKVIDYYNWGPEYNFAGNTYSEEAVGNPGMVKAIAKAAGLIGQAEELLIPAERVESEVGILYPRSSFYWDEKDVKLPRGIEDATNHRMMAGPDYLREVYALYRALAEILNVGCDFVDEDELLVPASLAKFKVLYVTEPDLPEEGALALLAWVKAGGTLVTVAGAGQFDQYDEPSAVFQTELLGSAEAPKARDISAASLTKNGSMASPPEASFANNHTGCADSSDALCGHFQACKCRRSVVIPRLHLQACTYRGYDHGAEEPPGRRGACVLRRQEPRRRGKRGRQREVNPLLLLPRNQLLVWLHCRRARPSWFRRNVVAVDADGPALERDHRSWRRRSIGGHL